MANREFLQLAHNFDPRKNSPCGWYASEKLDGIRCYWDGGITRGLPVTEIPFANTAKAARLKDVRVATGLWTRYGHVISAPDTFIEALPSGVPLDGELWSIRGWQYLTSAVKKLVPVEEEWNHVEYVVFDIPGYLDVFAEGRINNTNFKKVMDGGILDWVKGRLKGGKYMESMAFFKIPHELHEVLEVPDSNSWVYPHTQKVMEGGREVVDRRLEEMMDSVIGKGGEGLMLRDPVSTWTPKRTSMLLKMKGVQDAEGVVVGYRWGERTELGSKLLGLMGSLRLRLDSGVEFDLSGFTDAERVMDTCVGGDDSRELARECGMSKAGEVVDTAAYWNPLFPTGTKVTFQYRELSREGIPKEGRYHRKAVDL